MGKVGLNISNGTIQLRFLWEGKRKKLAVGLRDTPEYRKIARKKADLLERDLAYECVDHTFEKYRVLAKPGGSCIPDLWAKYREFKIPTVSKSTNENAYAAVATYLTECPYGALGEATKIRDWLLANKSQDASRRTIDELSRCCRWAGVDDPFQDLKLKKLPGRSPDPFTKKEREAILRAFEGNKFEDLVRFLFLSGCRTGEARALRWGKIASDYSSIEISESLSGWRDDLTGTKTHKIRKLPCNKQLSEFLRGLDKGFLRGLDRGKPEDLLFGQTKLTTFQRTWQRVVKGLVEDGRVSRYRAQYQTRATFITGCLDAGIPVTTIAKWVGNSSETIWKHYAGLIEKFVPPEI